MFFYILLVFFIVMNVVTYFLRKRFNDNNKLWVLSLIFGSIGNLVFCVLEHKDNKDQLIWEIIYNSILVLFQIYVLIHTGVNVL